MHRLDRGGLAHPEPPRERIVALQVLFALGCIVAGAWVFVGAVEHIASSLGVDSAILALVVAPVATELPEKLNSVIWVRQGKDTLAMGNITGAMVFQSAIPVMIALLFAPEAWRVDADSALVFASAGITFLSCVVIFAPMAFRSSLRGRGLLAGGVLYVLYLALVVAVVSGGSA